MFNRSLKVKVASSRTHFQWESDLLVLDWDCWVAASCCKPRVGLWKRRPLRRSSFCFMAARLLHSWTNLSTCREDTTSHFIFNFKLKQKALEPSSLTQIDSLDTGALFKSKTFFYFFNCETTLDLKTNNLNLQSTHTHWYTQEDTKLIKPRESCICFQPSQGFKEIQLAK